MSMFSNNRAIWWWGLEYPANERVQFWSQSERRNLFVQNKRLSKENRHYSFWKWTFPLSCWWLCSIGFCPKRKVLPEARGRSIGNRLCLKAPVFQKCISNRWIFLRCIFKSVFFRSVFFSKVYFLEVYCLESKVAQRRSIGNRLCFKADLLLFYLRAPSLPPTHQTTGQTNHTSLHPIVQHWQVTNHIGLD